MLENIFCLEGTIRVPEKLKNEIHTLIFKRIHSIIGQFNINVGLSYPEYENNKDKSVLGQRFRIFATIEDIAFFKRDKELSSLSEDGFFNFKMIDIPKKYDKVKYLRDRTTDNFYNKKNSRKKEPEKYPFIQLKSFSNKQYFKIKVKKEFVNHLKELDFKFNSFGLSNKNSNSWLPDF